MIVVLESIDGGGKDEQLSLLRGAIHDRRPDLEHTTFAFPNNANSPTGRAIKNLLMEKIEVSPGVGVHDSVAKEARAVILQSLQTANRYEQLELLNKYCINDSVLLLNRYYASGMAYGYADGVPERQLQAMHHGLPPAHLWMFLDITPEESIRRRPERRDEYERRAGFLDKVREGYLRLFRGHNRPPGHWVILDGMKSIQEVHRDIVNTVMPCLPQPYRI